MWIEFAIAGFNVASAVLRTPQVQKAIKDKTGIDPDTTSTALDAVSQEVSRVQTSTQR